MIKLIVSDLDGTLLNTKKQLPHDFDILLKELYSHNIKFIAASGRPVYTLKHNFSKVKEPISFIGDNGGVVNMANNINIANPIDKSLVLDVIKRFREINNPNLHIVLCAPNCAYIETTDKTINDEIDVYYVNKNIVDNVEEVKDEIVKITFYSEHHIEKITAEHFEPYFNDKLQLAVAGSVWLDIMAKGINKGTALKEVQKKFCISPEETMVFGDYFNDIEMFENAKYSFAMKDAPEGVKAYAKEVIGSNDDDSVSKTIREFLKKHIY